MAKQSLVGSFVPDDALTSDASSGSGASFSQPQNRSLVGSFIQDEDSIPSEKTTPKAKQYKDTTAADIAKSAGSGVELGVAQLAGLPGDIGRAVRYLGEDGKYYVDKAREHYGYAEPGTAEKNWKDVEAARESPDRDYVGYVPTSEALTKLAKKYVPGADYEPESRGGAYAHTIGEVVPAFFGGEGSLVKKLGTAAIAGGASEAAGQATEGTPYEGVARLGGMLAAPAAASKLSRPLGAAGSFLGIGDETLGAVGLTSDTQAAYNKIVAEGQRLKSIGALRGLSDQDIKTVLENERANGVAPQDSVIHSWSAISDSPTDVVNRFVKNSLSNRRVRNGVEDMYANAERAADQADVAASGMFQDMHNESAINAINAQRRAHGINDDIVEAPTADRLRATADEVRKGAWEREVQPIFDSHPSVDSSTLSSMLPLVEPKIVEQVKRNYNVIRQTRGQQPFEFLTQRNDGQYTTSGQGAAAYSTPFYQNLARKAGESDGVPKGAPLEFWDMLSNELQASQNKAHNVVGSQIKEGIEQYFTSKKLPNQLQEAKQSFRNIRGEGNALDAGMQFVNQGAYQTNPAKRAAFLNRWEKMNDVEKGLYQTGVMQQAFSTIAQGARGTINWDGVLQNRNNRQLLESILNFRPEGAPTQVGPTNFDKFNSALRVAKAFKRENASNVLANAPESRGFLSRLLGVGENSLVDVAVKSLYRGAYSPGAGYITALTGGFGYIRQVLADRQAMRMMEMFNSKDPNLAIKLARDIASSKEAQTSWQKVESLLDFTNKATINFYRRAAIAANNQQPQPAQHASGGRIEYGEGGLIPHGDPRREENLANWHSGSHQLTKEPDSTPKQYYTGTSKDQPFENKKGGFKVGRHGAWFTSDPKDASMYAETNDSQGYKHDGWKLTRTNTASRVIPTHIRAVNPYTGPRPEYKGENYKKHQSDWFDTLRQKGHDAWIPEEHGGNLAVVLGHGSQIKSSLGNKGTFNPNSTDIREKRGGFVHRPQRSTGGRIPEVDKLFKQAKKALDDGTKPMLNMPDDAIVHALRIAQGRV